MWRELLDRSDGDDTDLVDPESAVAGLRASAETLQSWYDGVLAGTAIGAASGVLAGKAVDLAVRRGEGDRSSLLVFTLVLAVAGLAYNGGRPR